MPPFVIVVDTNILIRGLLSPSGGSALLIDAIKAGKCVPITSREHLSELNAVLRRPRFIHRYGITSHRRKRFISRLFLCSIFVKPVGTLAICRDPKDDYLIELAILGHATHLVTEDADLYNDQALVELLAEYGVKVVRLTEFLTELGIISASNSDNAR